MKTLFALFALILSSSIIFAKTINIKDFGAVGDGQTDCTLAIQETFNACGNKNGTAVFPKGTYLCGSVELRGNMTIVLEEGAVWKGFDDKEKYKYVNFYIPMRFSSEPWRAFIYASHIKNLTITGKGTIDGSGEAAAMQSDGVEQSVRPYGIYMGICNNITIEGINMRNSGFWMQHYLECDSITLRGLNIWNHGNLNNDGIDIDGCQHVLIENCTIDSSDDAICLKSESYRSCENVLIQNCTLSTYSSAIKFGSGSVGGFKNISISNINVKPSLSKQNINTTPLNGGVLGIDIASVDGAEIENISLNNITIDGVQTPIFIRLGARLDRPIQTHEQKVGYIKNISLSKIKATNGGIISSSITGIPGHYIEDVTISDVDLSVSGGGTKEDTNLNIKEASTYNPENTMFKSNLPSYGLYVRHAKNIQINGMVLALQNKDERSAIILDDVIGFDLKKLSAAKPTLNPLIQFINSKEVSIEGDCGLSDPSDFIKIHGATSENFNLSQMSFRDVLYSDYAGKPKATVHIDTTYSIALNWSDNKPNPGLWQFQIQRDGKEIGVTRELSFVDFEPTEANKYLYKINPIDVWGKTFKPMEFKVSTPLDRILPEVQTIEILSNRKIRVFFSEPVRTADLVQSNFSIQPNVRINDVTVLSKLAVDLEITPLDKKVEYTLNVSTLIDLSQKGNVSTDFKKSFRDDPIVLHMKFEEEQANFDYTNVKFGEGWIGNCAYFDGKTSAIRALDNDYNLSGDIAVSFWCKLGDTETNSNFKILAKKPSWDSPSGYELEINPQKKLFNLMGGSTDSYGQGAVEITFDQKWNHYVAIISNNKLTLYKNTELVSSRDKVAFVRPSDLPLIIGAQTKAWIDELYIFKRTLGLLEIEELYGQTE